jgi:hypothetical protein
MLSESELRAMIVREAPGVPGRLSQQERETIKTAKDSFQKLVESRRNSSKVYVDPEYPVDPEFVRGVNWKSISKQPEIKDFALFKAG